MASKSHLEFAIYSAKMGIWDIDLSTQSVFCSQEMLDLWGVSTDEYKNNREILQSKVHPDDLQKMRDAIDHAVQTGQIYQLEYRIFPSPEQEKWVLSRGRCIYDQSSERPSRFSGVVFDITDRKLAELKRQASEQMLVTALSERDRSLETLSIINEVGRSISAELELEKLVQLVTDAATKVSGAQFGAFFYNTVNADGQAYLLYTISGAPKEAFSHLPLPRVTEIFHPTFFGEGTVRSDDLMKDARYGKNAPYHGMPAGHLPVRSYLAVSVVSRSGEVLGGIFLGHEETAVFTERSQKIVEGLASQTAVALDNARLYRKLQEAVHARDEFLSIASHELKTPLTTLKFQSQMRARNLRNGNVRAYSEERLKKMAETDAKQVEHLSRLVDDMLDISRINTGKFTIEPEKFDLCELAQDVLDRHLSQFEEANTPVRLVTSGSVEGSWDIFRIEQVISNLLTNSIRYGRSKPVEITVKREKDLAILTVQDQGIGIAKEHQTRIFERFERAVSATEISGLGLGLYIVKQILEMHRGKIKVESDLGAGSTFFVELPIDIADY